MRIQAFFTQLSKNSDALSMWESWWYSVMEGKTRIRKRKINLTTKHKGHSQIIFNIDGKVL